MSDSVYQLLCLRVSLILLQTLLFHALSVSGLRHQCLTMNISTYFGLCIWVWLFSVIVLLSFSIFIFASIDKNTNMGKETIAYINEKDLCRCINSEGWALHLKCVVFGRACAAVVFVVSTILNKGLECFLFLVIMQEKELDVPIYSGCCLWCDLDHILWKTSLCLDFYRRILLFLKFIKTPNYEPSYYAFCWLKWISAFSVIQLSI